MPGHAPSFVSTSLWQTPQACTLMRTSPAPGSGTSRSTISKSPPGLEIWATFIGAKAGFGATLNVAISPPVNFGCEFKSTYRCQAPVYCLTNECATRPRGTHHYMECSFITTDG